MEVIGNIKYVTGVTQYVVNNDDGTINVDASVNAITIILPNILNSGYYGTAKGFIINDISNNASVNNITIVAANNSVNSASSVIINQNGGTAKCSIANQNEWFIVREPETAGGVSSADNGLTLNVNTVELGGTLTKDTIIDVSTFDFDIKDGINQSFGVKKNGDVISEKSYSTTTNSGTAVILGIDSNGKLFNTQKSTSYLDTIWLANGNSFGSEKYFGTNDNFSIPIYTNNIAIGIFGNNGDFAFGSSSLLAKTRVYIKGFNSVDTHNALVIDSSSEVIAVFRNDGNVGIGTLVPSAKLHIIGDNDLGILNLGDSYSTTKGDNIKFVLYDSGTYKTGLGVSSGQLDYQAGSVNVSHVFYSGTNRSLIIQSDGHVGIGITDIPFNILNTFEVKGTAYFSNNNGTFYMNTQGIFSVSNTPEYTNNASAISAGLQAGNFYIRTGHGLDVVV